MFAAIKRTTDIILATLGIIVLAPLMGLCALAVLLDDGRPVIYAAARTGRYGVPFRMLKFRTMVVGAEAIGGTSTAETDPRITASGSLLRRFKLDELPQLFNVLQGEMSFVGPRPEVDEYTDMYSDAEKQILEVRPGITDYASIRFRNLNSILARSADPDAYYRDVIRPEKNRLRLEYARHNNPWVDLKIIVETVSALFRRGDAG